MDLQVKTIISLLCLSASAVLGSAANAAEYDDFARVVNVTPQVEQFNQPEEDCRTEYVPVQQQEHNVGGAIVGGVAGGLIGSQVGGGRGRSAATAAGAIAGALIGDRAGNNQDNVTEQPVRQCRTVDHWQSRTSGYAVTYEYHGRTYTSVMPYEPGDRIKLHVSITPR